MNEGWILIHRKLQESQIWSSNEPFDMRSAWIDLLMLANHDNATIIFDGQPLEIKRGQYLTSVRKLSLRWGWGNEKTLKYLRLLENLQMIKKNSNKRRTLLTIENYDVYQNTPNTNRTQTEQRPNTDQAQTINVKNEKENNNKRFVKPTADEVRAYCQEKGFNVDADRFVDYYESKGWVVGKSPMKDWKAAARNWNSRAKETTKQKQKTGNERGYDKSFFEELETTWSIQ